jgi:oligopeptide transport system ATP-binding protein
MVIEVKNLVKHFFLKKWIGGSEDDGLSKAVDNVSFSVDRREMFGLIGDSGCGKTTIARTISALLRPTAGEVLYEGENIFSMNKKRFKKYRQEVRGIFQNPDSCLNPHMKIRNIIAEVFKIHTDLKRGEIDTEIEGLFGMMGLSASFLERYRYQLSIGQKRKIGLARAFAVVPKFLIADEPFAGLDISTKMELTWIMQKLKEKYEFGALIISHDLESVRNLCSRIAVMYEGKIIELFGCPALISKKVYHPYTQTLLRQEGQVQNKLILKRKFHASPKEVTGCRFFNQCQLYQQFDRPSVCRKERPELRTTQDDHQVACHFCDGT